MQYLPEYIDKISARFVNVYSQAMQAEKHGLDEICGAGYRKAVEILIRDYLISKTTSDEDKEKITRTNLAACIELLDNDIKELAQGATWLGADFVHYSKHHEEFGLDDLKGFIESIVIKIQSEFKQQESASKLKIMKENKFKPKQP